MSTNPETWRKALRLSDRRLLARFALLVASGVAVLLAAISLPWTDIAQAFHERQDERAALAVVLAEAKRLDLTFPQVVVSHPAHVGKPVYWDVSVLSSSASWVEGHPAWPIIWTNPDRVKAERIWKDRVLARVAVVMDEAVYLEFVGRP